MRVAWVRGPGAARAGASPRRRGLPRRTRSDRAATEAALDAPHRDARQRRVRRTPARHRRRGEDAALSRARVAGGGAGFGHQRSRPIRGSRRSSWRSACPSTAAARFYRGGRPLAVAGRRRDGVRQRASAAWSSARRWCSSARRASGSTARELAGRVALMLWDHRRRARAASARCCAAGAAAVLAIVRDDRRAGRARRVPPARQLSPRRRRRSAATIDGYHHARGDGSALVGEARYARAGAAARATPTSPASRSTSPPRSRRPRPRARSARTT